MLTDTGRRITALDDVEDAFRNFFEPIGAVLRALERETTDNVGLRSALADFVRATKRCAPTARRLRKGRQNRRATTTSLRRELALAQLAARTLESDNTELGGRSWPRVS